MKRLSSILIFVILAVIATRATATDYTWTGIARDGNYANPANWLGGNIPVSNTSNTVYFSDQGAGAITLAPLNVTLNKLVFQNTISPYIINGNGATLTFTNGIETTNGDVTIQSLNLANTTLNVTGHGQLTLNNVTSPASPGNALTITGNSTVLISGTAKLAANLAVQQATVILSGSATLPSSGKITLSSPGSYAGYTQNFAARFSDFLDRIQAITDPNAIVGIDSTTPAINRTVSDSIDLSTLNGADRTAPYYIGTTSHITLTGPITPTRIPAGGYDNLYLTAINNGYLNIATNLGDTNSPVNAVVIGQRPADQTASPGTVELSGNNIYAGDTHVLGGTLQINGNNNIGSGSLTVGNSATLNTGANASISNAITFAPGSTVSGAGTFTSPVTIGSGVNLVPGNYGSAATIHFHDALTIQGGSNLYLDLGATANDVLCIHDSLTIQASQQNSITIYLASITNGNVAGTYAGFNPNAAYTWSFAYNTGAPPITITGFDASFFSINAAEFARYNNTNGGIFDIAMLNNNTLAITFTPVPEPGTYALMAAGLLALALIKRRQKRRASRD